MNVDLRLVETLAKEHGLQASKEALLAAVRPAMGLMLGPDDEEPPPGRSRMGGRPDWPVGEPWPRNARGEAYSFIFQLDLAEVAAETPGNPLPGEGMAYLFMGHDEPANDFDAKFVIHPPGRKLAPARLPRKPRCHNDNLYGDGAFSIYRLRTRAAPDLPRLDGPEYRALIAAIGATDDEALAERYRDFARAVMEAGMPRAIGWFLGHAAVAQHDHREYAYIVREVDPKAMHDHDVWAKQDMTKARAWRPFLTVESNDDVGLLIWDFGSWNFLIRENDLAAGRFDRLYNVVESS